VSRACENAPVDDLQERQLRSWAESLCQSAATDQRATGKAMLMLLEQIDSLRVELEQQAAEPEAPEPSPADGQDPAEPPEPSSASIEDTATISLRDRLRAAARRTTP
jgi:hypothetical protein